MSFYLFKVGNKVVNYMVPYFFFNQKTINYIIVFAHRFMIPLKIIAEFLQLKKIIACV